MSTARRIALLAAVPALATLPLGCPLLEGVDGSILGTVAPEVSSSEPELRTAPALADLGAYYCPQLLDSPAARFTCSAALGEPPPAEDLVFEFGVALTMQNPNDVPIPALDVLLGLTLFDGQDAESLGAICVSTCGEDDPECDGSPRPGACETSQTDVASLDDFADRLPGLVADLAGGQAIDELRDSTIAAGGDLTMDLTFELGVDQALSVFRKTAQTWVEDFVAGRDAALAVPVTGEGSVFFDVPSLGQIAVGYGPISGTWNLQ
ncbi:MAG: hypothetical protein ACQEXJ_14950 [Myxococcota bacterium]